MSDLVYRHQSGGELHQGNLVDAEHAASGAFDAIVTCNGYRPRLNSNVFGGFISLEDRTATDDADAKRIESTARACADRVARMVQAGKRVMVTCHAGLNRSGLVSGLALRELGLDADSAIRAVRKARGSHALSNHFFEKVVRS